MKDFRISERRHHKNRLRKKRQQYVAHWKTGNKRALGIAVETPTAVSGYREKGPSHQDLRHGDWQKEALLAGDVAFIQGNRILTF